MRDKVKRFLSILMTALMLVNLLPVGALAEGFTISNSVQSIGWWDGYPVFVFVKVEGDTTGLTMNSDHWFTLGMVESMPGVTKPPQYVSGYQDKINGVTADQVKNRMTRYKPNKSINLDGITWMGFKSDRGASDTYDQYKNQYCWHLDGSINIEELKVNYTIRYVDENNNKEIASSKTKTGKAGSFTEVEREDIKDITGYTYTGYYDPMQKLIGGKDTVINVYYRPNSYSYRVEHYYDGEIDNSKTDTIHALYGSEVDKNTLTLKPKNGYEFEKTENCPLTIGTDESKNVIKVYYKKIDYTVTYVPGKQGTFESQSYDKKHYGDDTPAFDGETTGNPGWTFAGWAPEVAETVTENVTYTAQWTQNEYTVTYVPGKQGTFESQSYDKKHYGDDTPAFDGETTGNPGWTFAGWAPEVAETVTENVTYIAQWTKRTDLIYTVNYYWNGTTEEVADPKIVENQTFDDEVTEFPEKDIPGCTPVSNDSKTIKIGTGTNEINFYYYKNVELEANSATLSYNGKAQSVFGFTGAPKDADFSNITVGATGTDAETYPAEFAKKTVGTVDVTEKYIVTAANNGQLVITPRSVTLTSASDSKVYDGTALTNDKVTVGGADGFADGEGAEYNVTGTQTNVGSSDNTFTYTLKKGTKADNYDIKTENGTLTVTPVTDKVTVTITGNTASEKYDGTEKTASGYGVSISNEKYTEADFEFKGNAEVKGTDANTYPMGLTAANFTNKSANFTNVEFVVTDGSLTINKRSVTLTSASASKTYDGTALEKPVVTVGGDGFVEGQVTEIKATGSVTNAGSVANTITFTPNKETFKDGNYAITKTEGTLTIAKRSVLITSQSATKTYDGSALTRPAVTITGDGFVPGELAKAEATGSITNVGSTPNTIQYTTTGAFNAANYSIALSVGTLTVTEKPKPEPRRTFNLTINYVYQNGKRAAASYNRGGLKNGETFDITSPVIAGYTASETVVSGTIYNRDIKVTVIYTADGVNLDDYGVPLGLGNITMNVGDCFE